MDAFPGIVIPNIWVSIEPTHVHDTLAQDVAGLVLQLEAAHAHLCAGRSERVQAIVQQAMARAALRNARAAIDDLRAMDMSA